MRSLVSEDANNFDAIRLVMALSVVWSHSFALYLGSEASEPVSLLTHGIVNAGNVAVEVFFVVSGFLITQSFARSRSWWSFLRKRAGRIYPGYLVATSLCAFVLLPWFAGTRYTPLSVVKTIGLNLLLRNWFVNPDPFVNNDSSALNGSLWSIPIEFWCYIGVMAFGLLKLRRRFLLCSCVVVVAIHVWTVATGKLWGGGWVGVVLGWPNVWFRMAPFFMSGMLLYLYRELVPRSAYLAVGGLMLFVLCAWLLPLAAQALLPAVLAYAVMYWAFSRQLVPAARYGDFSYGVYLYAYPIQQLLVASAGLSFLAYLLASLGLALVAGIVSWYAVERWFHRPREPALPTKQSSLASA